jgi:1,2-dihydroxy-3-keto-5-methylthiopentene dioxygenase
MTLLTIWPDTDSATQILRSEDPAVIAEALAEIGVDFSRWKLVELPEGANADDVLQAYASQVEQVKAEQGFITVDAVAMARDNADADWDDKAAVARAKFLNEHTHADDEVRFFARGAGVFYLRVNDRVHAVLCTAGDLISVPDGTRHWFDMGTEPDFAAVRFFREDDGWVGDFTGDPIAESFPDFDALTANSNSFSRM